MGRYEREQPPKKKKTGLIIALTAVLLLAAGFGGYELWHYQQPKFQDVTIELGTDAVSMSDFMTEYARPKRVGFVSDISQVDLNKVGSYELTLRHGRQEKTVTLTVQDTTAPQVQFVEVRQELASYEPKPEDFVENIQDLSDTRVTFAEPVEAPESYEDMALTVVVTDAEGNETRGECTLTWAWLLECVTLELGDTLTLEQLLVLPEKDAGLIAQEDLDRINGGDVGTYTLVSSSGGNTMSCVVTVEDTKGPELILQNGKCKPKEKVTLDTFVVSAEDASGKVELRLLTELDTTEKGSYPVKIEAEDKYGNITSGEVMLHVTTDLKAPVITGAEEMLEVEKGSTPDYLKDVTAEDQDSGLDALTCDASGVDTSRSGTYFVTYKATDLAGNETTVKRTVLVLPDEADIDALVASIAADLPDDPEKLRNYVRDKFGYNSNWGGTYPVWYGFTNMNGNCYVHAVCLQALFDAKGIESQLIWTTKKSHYWLVVNIDGRWLHIDPTPGPSHSKYSLMTDAMRRATLDGRTWEKGIWPVCE